MWECRNLTNPRHTQQLMGVTTSVLDMYGDVVASSPRALGLFSKLHTQVGKTHSAEMMKSKCALVHMFF